VIWKSCSFNFILILKKCQNFSRIQVVHELRNQPFIGAKLQEIRRTLDKSSKENVYDTSDEESDQTPTSMAAAFSRKSYMVFMLQKPAYFINGNSHSIQVNRMMILMLKQSV